MGNEDFVEVFAARTKGEASVIKGLLESEGVPVLLNNSSDFSSTVHPIDPFQGTKILVPKDNVSVARSIIEAFKSSA